MKKCMIYFLVVALLCGSLLAACAPEEAVASHPGTTVPKHTTQTQTKPTGTQTKPTEPKPTETQPKPTEPQPTVPPVTYPILMDFNYKVYTTYDHANNHKGVQNIWVLNSEEDRAAISNLDDELAGYDTWYFDTHYLIVVEIFDHIHEGIRYQPANIQKLERGGIHLELEVLVEKGTFVPDVAYYNAYYMIIELQGSCKENAPVTWNLTVVRLEESLD